MEELSRVDTFGLPIMEMARIAPKESGLPVAVVILIGKGLPHGPRIKVSTILGGDVRSDSLVSVTISDDPQFIHSNSFSSELKNKISAFVKKNQKVLHDHYYGKITDREALNLIQPV